MATDIGKVLPTKDPLATAILMLFLGIVLLALGAGALHIVLVFAGALLLVIGATVISRGMRGGSSGDLTLGIVISVVGLLLVIATGLMSIVLVVVLALLLMVLGVMAIVSGGSGRGRTVSLIVGVTMILIGLVLLLYPGATSDLAMRVLGLVMIAASALSLRSYVR